jgi:hypothetical protein
MPQAMMNKLVQNLLKTKLISGFLKNKGLKQTTYIIAGLLVIWLLPTLLYQPKNKPTSDRSPEISQLVDSLNNAKAKTDPFAREAFIQQEAKKLGKTTDEYRKLLSLRKQNGEVLPDAPIGHSLPQWTIWYFDQLTPGQRLVWVGGGLLWLIEKVAGLTVVFAGIRFFLEIPQREKQAKYQAWQVVHTAHGQRVSGARISALEDLREQGESLAALELEYTVLRDINLQGANLHKVNLRRSHLERANLAGANLTKAKVEQALLWRANLENADLENANLENASLREANLKGANLKGANLKETSIEGANLKGANLWDVENLTPEQLATAITDATTRLPAYLLGPIVVRQI